MTMMSKSSVFSKEPRAATAVPPAGGGSSSGGANDATMRRGNTTPARTPSTTSSSGVDFGFLASAFYQKYFDGASIRSEAAFDALKQGGRGNVDACEPLGQRVTVYSVKRGKRTRRDGCFFLFSFASTRWRRF